MASNRKRKREAAEMEAAERNGLFRSLEKMEDDSEASTEIKTLLYKERRGRATIQEKERIREIYELTNKLNLEDLNCLFDACCHSVDKSTTPVERLDSIDHVTDLTLRDDVLSSGGHCWQARNIRDWQRRGPRQLNPNTRQTLRLQRVRPRDPNANDDDELGRMFVLVDSAVPLEYWEDLFPGSLELALMRELEKRPLDHEKVRSLILLGNVNCKPAFTYACKSGLADVVRLIINDGRVDPAADENNALRLASAYGHTGVVRLLLSDERVNPAAADDYAFGLASDNGHTEVVRLLLSDKRVKPATRDNYAIRVASAFGHTGVLRLLLEDGRVNPAAGEGLAQNEVKILLQGYMP